jgi:peroxiredoxin Q/BCP
VILGVSFDTPAENAAFAAKFGFNYPLLCDTDRRMGVAYGAADGPDAGNARRAGVVVGPDGRVRSWEGKVDARTWPQEVLGRL